MSELGKIKLVLVKSRHFFDWIEEFICISYLDPHLQVHIKLRHYFKVSIIYMIQKNGRGQDEATNYIAFIKGVMRRRMDISKARVIFMVPYVVFMLGQYK